jgi:uncharacterized protein (DUF58 family)
VSRTLRPARRTLVSGLLLLIVVVLWQGYGAWQASTSKVNAEVVSGVNKGAERVALNSGLPPTDFSDSSVTDSVLPGPGVALLLVVLLVLAADLVLSWHYPMVSVKRRLTRSLSLDQWVNIELQISSPLPRSVRIEVMDFVPEDCDFRQLPASLTLLQGQYQLLTYRCCPRRRGPLVIRQCAVRANSLFGLWQIAVVQPLVSNARVYPDFASVEGYQLLATDHQTSQLGIKRKPRRGEGMDFHQLREYRLGDSLRQIDWNATSRRQRLISREYQDERDQQVILMLDSGRRMLTQDGIATHFDHCLNCLLMLSYVALRQGDSVGMMSFGSALRYTSPVKGAANISRMVNQFYDLYPDKSAPDYLQAAEALVNRYRKRSLIVFATNLRDEDTDDFLCACQLLQRHHLVMVANLRESSLDRVLTTPVADFQQALRYAGTMKYLQQRDKVQSLLKAQGLYIIDSLPQQLTPQLVNNYFAIKRAGVL